MHDPPAKRPESQEGATGLVWDSEKGRWLSEAEDAALQTSSQLTAVEGRQLKEEAEQGKGTEPLWIEWDGPLDPDNPFNVSCGDEERAAASSSAHADLELAWL